jgi:hypothetical protein
MFDRIFDGLVGAVISAVGAILAAYIARGYAAREVQRTPSDRPLPKLASTLVGLFTTLQIPGAKRFSVSYGSAYTDAHLDLIVGLGGVARSEKLFSTMDAHVNLTVPGAAGPEVVTNPLPGWSRVFHDRDATYRLTLIQVTDKYTFELRALDGPKGGSHVGT